MRHYLGLIEAFALRLVEIMEARKCPYEALDSSAMLSGTPSADYDKLFNTFGPHRERPHDMRGLRARLAARVALHDSCIWLNEQLGRPWLAFADLLQW